MKKTYQGKGGWTQYSQIEQAQKRTDYSQLFDLAALAVIAGTFGLAWLITYSLTLIF